MITIRHLVFVMAFIAAMAYPEADALSDREALIQAHRGDTASMRIIGKRKFYGSPANGTRLDRDNGFAWLKKAAGGGDVEAKYLMGIIYCNGEYVSKNIHKGVQYLTDAANQGNEKAVKALQQLPLQYSAPWIIRKAEEGDMTAAMDLAKAYLLGGGGISPNESKAIKYFMMGYRTEPSKAIKMLKSWKPTSKALPIWRALAESEHDVSAALMLGKLYDKGGSGVSPHIDSARKYYSLAADAGNKDAVLWMKQHVANNVKGEERATRTTQADARKDEWKRVLLQEPEVRLEWLKKTLEEISRGVSSSADEWNMWHKEYEETVQLVKEREREREKARAREWVTVKGQDLNARLAWLNNALAASKPNSSEWNMWHKEYEETEREKARAREWVTVKGQDSNAKLAWLNNALAASKPNSSEWHMWNREFSLLNTEIRRKDEIVRIQQWEKLKNASSPERINWLMAIISDNSISHEERDKWKNELIQFNNNTKKEPSTVPNKVPDKVDVPDEKHSLWGSLVNHILEALIGLMISAVGAAVLAKFRKKKE